jgi:hypothetical protein
MRKFFATKPDIDELPSWEQDPRVVDARARERELNIRQAQLQQQARDLRHGGDGSLITVPSPSHPFWPLQREFEGAYAEWKVAERELAQAEATVKADAAQGGYDAGFAVWQEEIVAVIEQLIAGLTRFQCVRETVYARSGAQIGELGTVSLEPKALREFLVQVERRGTFGTRE